MSHRSCVSQPRRPAEPASYSWRRPQARRCHICKATRVTHQRRSESRLWPCRSSSASVCGIPGCSHPCLPGLTTSSPPQDLDLVRATRQAVDWMKALHASTLTTLAYIGISVAPKDLEVFHANLASHAAAEPAMRAVLARRRAASRTKEAELGLEYRWHFERLRQRVEGACLARVKCCVAHSLFPFSNCDWMFFRF